MSAVSKPGEAKIDGDGANAVIVPGKVAVKVQRIQQRHGIFAARYADGDLRTRRDHIILFILPAADAPRYIS